MPRLLLKLLFTLMPKRTPALLRPLVRKVCNQALTTLVNPQLKQHMAFWEGELGNSEWFAGSAFTAADIQMSFPLEAMLPRAADSTRVIPRRWHFGKPFTPARPINARLKRAVRIRSGARSGPLVISSLRGAQQRSNLILLRRVLDCSACARNDDLERDEIRLGP